MSLKLLLVIVDNIIKFKNKNLDKNGVKNIVIKASSIFKIFILT